MDSYQLPHRIYGAKSYPVQAPNGSSIIIYGHDFGIRVIWRGGRNFKSRTEQSQPSQPENTKPNGANKDDDAVMIIDSDDEEPAAESAENVTSGAEFEDEEDEIDPSRPFQTILRYFDIPLGSKVLGLSVPPQRKSDTRFRADTYPTMLSSLIVVAASCADGSVKAISLPLSPPPPSVVDSTELGVQTLTLSGGLVQTVPTGVSITFTRRKATAEGPRSQSRNRSGKSTPDFEHGNTWDLLLAVNSAEACGTLSIYQVPIIQNTSTSSPTYSFSSDAILLQHMFLSSPAKSISFNPCSYPSERHSHLLVAFASGCVKTYACLNAKPRNPTADRRGSVSDSSHRESEGNWLVSLYPDFEQNSSRRKSVVDAKWAFGGKAIVALLSDGTWGVWDVEGSGPGRKDNISYLSGQNDSSNIAGGVLKSFAISGRVSSSQASKAAQPAQAPEQKSSFVPMTPSTRRIREDTLFKGSSTSTTTNSTRGGISVNANNSLRDGNSDESIVIWHGDHNVWIPSLLSFWRTSVNPTGTFDSVSRSRPAPIENLTLFGEMQNGINQTYQESSSSALSNRERSKQAPKREILISTEHRLILLTPKTLEPENQTLGSIPEDTMFSQGDQIMLNRGQLDIDGMDRVLAGMASGSKSVKSFRSPQKHRLFT